MTTTPDSMLTVDLYSMPNDLYYRAQKALRTLEFDARDRERAAYSGRERRPPSDERQREFEAAEAVVAELRAYCEGEGIDAHAAMTTLLGDIMTAYGRGQRFAYLSPTEPPAGE